MLLILEMGRPFAGLMQISTVGVAALTHCRKKSETLADVRY
jgi:hypothetical protein